MRKNRLVLILSLFTFLNLSCQQSKENNTPAQTQVVGNYNTDCVTNPQLCQQGAYQQNQGFGTYPYGTTGYPYGANGPVYINGGWYNSGATPFYVANSAAYLCNCPSGSLPTYNTYSGLGCVNSQTLGGANISAYAYMSWGVNNRQWLNVPQISNLTGYPTNNCFNGVIQSCALGLADVCGAGYTCKQTNAASSLGVCTAN